jgi:osmoprotectant transport system ATP-binding protein
MIRFEHVGKTYANDAVVLKNINLHVKEGELLALIGPSGCGKTTTMRMINRLIDPTEGQIFVNGENILRKNPVELRRNIGYVIQQIGLLPHLTIQDNIALVPKLKKWEKSRYLKRVDELLDLVGLDPDTFKKRIPSELSGGQQQRIGVIRALAADPPIILMDEPFSALDPISREQLQDELIKLQREIQKTIVFVTHDMDEAIKIANRMVIMQHGEIVQLDTPQNILARPQNQFVREFIGSERLNKPMSQPTACHVTAVTLTVSHPDRSLNDARDVLKENNAEQLCLVDHDQTFIGIVSLKDIEEALLSKNKTLEDISKKDPLKVKPDTIVSEVARLFRDQQAEVLPVVQEDKLIGIITRNSLIDGIAKWDKKEVS